MSDKRGEHDSGTLADMFSLPTELEHNGKRYPIRPPTIEEQGRFQRWLEQRALDVVERTSYRDDAAREAAYKRFEDSAAAGEYEWGGEVAARAHLTISGATKLVSLIAGCPEDEAREVVETHRRRVSAVLQAAVTNDPKALAEALKTLGLPSEILSGSSGARRSTRAKKKSRR